MSTDTSTRSRWVRRVTAVLGVVAFTIGVLTALSPATANTSLQTLVVILGNDYFVVAIVGVVGLLIVVAVLISRGKTGLDQTTPPAAEEVQPAPRFGEEFDTFFEGAGMRDMSGGDGSQEVRSQLREIAITTVMRDENCTQAEARDQVESGVWTDNDMAATFLAESATIGLGTRLKAALTGRSPSTQAARATAAEIVRRDTEAMR